MRGRHSGPQIAESRSALHAFLRFLHPLLPIDAVADIIRGRCAPGRCRTQLCKQGRDIASGKSDPAGVFAGNESFATISTDEKTVHHRPEGFWRVVEPRPDGSIVGAM